MTNDAVSGLYAQVSKLSFLEQACLALEASEPEAGHTPGPDKIIHALHAVTWALLSVAEETSRS
jgi:hypothetical protein